MKSYRSRLFRGGLATSRSRREVFLSLWADGRQGRGADMMDIFWDQIALFYCENTACNLLSFDTPHQ
jgi:hypothetical protein